MGDKATPIPENSNDALLAASFSDARFDLLGVSLGLGLLSPNCCLRSWLCPEVKPGARGLCGDLVDDGLGKGLLMHLVRGVM